MPFSRLSFINLIFWTNAFLGLVLVLSCIAPYINPAKLWPFSFLGTSYPYLLLINSLFFIFWIIIKKKYLWLPILIFLIGINHINTVLGLNFFQNPKAKDSISLMSYNLGGLEYLKANTEKEKKNKEEKVLDFFKNGGVPDILCVQELGWLKFIPNNLNYKNTASNKGVAIHTNFEIIEKGKIKFENTINSAVWADLKIVEDTIRVYNIHLQSNKVSQQTEELIENANLNSKSTFYNLRKILAKVKWATSKRVEQTKQLERHMKSAPFPIILAGDFNDTPQSFIYRTLSRGLNSSFKKKGRGLGITYAGNIPGLHIDHILLDKQLKVKGHRIENAEISDHYPVISYFAFK